MKKLVAALAALPLLASTYTFAADRFEEKDFTWEPFTSLYKRVIVVGVNKIAAGNPECATLDPKSLQRYGGTPDDPEFQVTCGEPGKQTHPHFSKSEITGDPASNVPIEDQQH